MKKELLNITQLAKKHGLDRTTVATRLDEAGMTPLPGSNSRDKLFDAAAAAAVLESETDADYERERARKTRLDADMKELELKKARAEVLEVYEVREQVQKIVQRMYQRFAIQLPKEVASKLARTKVASDVEKALREEATKIFSELRRDHAKMLEGE